MKVEYDGGPLDGLNTEFPVSGIVGISIHAGDMEDGTNWYTCHDPDWHQYDFDEYENSFKYKASTFRGNKLLNKIFNQTLDDYRPKLEFQFRKKCKSCGRKEYREGQYALSYCRTCIVKLYRNGTLIDK